MQTLRMGQINKDLEMKKKLVKKLSDAIFGNPFIEYVLDENLNYKEQNNANKDLFIYINGIEVGSISPGELEELQYRVFYSGSLWWSIFKNVIGFFLKPAMIAFCALPLGVFVLLWLSADNPVRYSREIMMLQDSVQFNKTMSGLFHLFYWISLFGTFVKLVVNQDSIFSIFNKELFENIKSYKKLKIRGSASMDIVAVRD